MSSAGSVGADQYLLPDGAAGSERQLRQCCSGHADVVDGGVGSGVSGPEQEAREFTGAVFAAVVEREQWMESEV